MTNLYAILDIGPHAPLSEVKAAYRRCARNAHPDHQGDVERFRSVQEAYEVLGDAEKRDAYDQQRRAWIRQIGAVECGTCGSANRVTRRPAPGEITRCAHCKSPLRTSLSDLLSAQRQSLVNETARFVDEVGIELAELAADAVKSSLGKIRQRLRFGGSQRPSKPKQ